MKENFKAYSVEESLVKIDEILENNDSFVVE